MRKHTAFTLIESLVVLMIVSIIVFLPTLMIRETTKTIETLYFFDRLEKSILTSQQVAIISNKSADILQPDLKQLAFQLTTGDWLETLTVPDTLVASKLSKKISFAGGTGNVGEQRQIQFIWQDKKQKVSYVFLFGKGHYNKVVTTL
ncbi:MAG TPA: competence type IV pilus minor pilin ComGD [Enterococcus sp.]|nr:competence type IV pilus minor pilin ComGD [Enterococcus sp.]HPR81464.1 competence type IV pilus minor pilin ComGD [Enterococcus sp.]